MGKVKQRNDEDDADATRHTSVPTPSGQIHIYITGFLRSPLCAAHPWNCLLLYPVVLYYAPFPPSAHLAAGAVAARPPSCTTPIVHKCCRRIGPASALVMASAQLTEQSTFENLISPWRAFVWTHRSETARCLTLPRPNRETIPIAAVASVRTSICTATPKSARSERRPKASTDAFTTRL